MKSIFYATLALAAQAQVKMALVGRTSAIHAEVSVHLDSDPMGSVTYLPGSDDESALFSATSLTFDSSNYMNIQTIFLKRKSFIPYDHDSIRVQNFTFILKREGQALTYTLPITWLPISSHQVTVLGDPHISSVINVHKPLGCNYASYPCIKKFDTDAITKSATGKYYSLLKNFDDDWEVFYKTGPFGSFNWRNNFIIHASNTSVATRVCVRYGNHAVCVDKDNKLIYLNEGNSPLAIYTELRSNSIQIMLPSGTTIKTNNNFAHRNGIFTISIIIQPTDLRSLTGLGVVTKKLHDALIPLTTTPQITFTPVNNDIQIEFVQNYTLYDTVVPSISKRGITNQAELISLLDSDNSRDGITFPGSRSTYSRVFYDTDSLFSPYIHRIIVASTTTYSKIIDTAYATKTTTNTVSLKMDATSTTTKRFSATATSTILVTATSTNFETSSITSTTTAKFDVSSTIVEEAMTTLTGDKTVAFEVLTTAVNVIDKDVTYTNTITSSINHDETVTNVVDKTEVQTSTISSTAGKVLYVLMFFYSS